MDRPGQQRPAALPSSSLRLRLRRPTPVLCPVTALAFFRRRRRPAAGRDGGDAADSSLFVLAGEDGWLAVYGVDGEEDEDAPTAWAARHRHRCCGRLRVFAEQAIQGFRVGDVDGDVLVWGGRSAAWVAREQIEGLVDGQSDSRPSIVEVKASAWIYDGLLPPHSGCAGALITAHNEVLPFWVRAEAAGREESGRPALVLASRPISPSRPMLFSAQLAWVADDRGSRRLLVAAGTVFGEIVVWTCRLPSRPEEGGEEEEREEREEDGLVQVLDTFTGHEGSIFGVALSPDLPTSHGRVRLLASCSDDRTIRVWPVFLDRTADTPPAATAQEPRETGFRNELVDGDADRLPSSTAVSPPTAQRESALAVVMGHASRIWEVRFGALVSSPSDSSSLFVYSFGEDATAQEWRLDVTQEDTTAGPVLAGRLEHRRTVSSHVGKNIWAAAVLPRGGEAETTSLVATGACDGKICVFAGGGDEASSATIVSASVPPRATEALSSDYSSAEAPPPKKGSQKRSREELFNSYAFVSESQLLAATTHGRLFLGTLTDSEQKNTPLSASWTEVSVPAAAAAAAALCEYNVVRSPRGGGGGGLALAPGVDGLAFVGTASGRVFLYSVRSGLQELAATQPGKVEEILFLPDVRAGGADEGGLRPTTVAFQVLVTVLRRHEVTVLDVAVDVGSGRLLSESSSSSSSSSSRIVPLPAQAAAVTAASRCCGHLVLGSRKGQLLVYEGDSDVLLAQAQARTGDAILAIVPLPPLAGAGSSPSSSFVVTTRDGHYRIYTIDRRGTAAAATAALHLRHETAPPFGPIVRDAWFLQPDGPGSPPELVLCGFRSTQFVVWNETRQQEMAAVDCGGTHRAHTYMMVSSSSSSSSSSSAVRFAFTRNARLCVFAQATTATGTATATLKTGGHGREIKAASTSASGAYVATGGEDTVVRIWRAMRDDSQRRPCLAVLKRHNTGVHNVAWLGDDCLVSAAGSEELFVWRIARIADSAYDGLAVLGESSYPDGSLDKIVRITAMDATLEEGGAALITVALSSSVLKTYRYDAGRWQRLAPGAYTGACPTQLRHLRLRPGRELVTLAAFADGHLTLWRARARPHDDGGPHPYEDYALASATQVHRNAVKSLDVSLQHGGGVVLTGGDDNAVAVTPMRWRDSIDADADADSRSSDLAFRQTVRVASAHAAAVTGMCILEASPASLTAVSCSNDQRVKAWRVLLPETDQTDLTHGTDSSQHGSTRVQLLDNQYSAVADPAGLTSLVGQDGTAMVVGMGMETWRLVGE